MRYEIRIDGGGRARNGRDAHWSVWFDGMEIADDADGITVISGDVTDQSALHGLLIKVRDLGLQLHSVTRTASEPPDRGAGGDVPADRDGSLEEAGPVIDFAASFALPDPYNERPAGNWR